MARCEPAPRYPLLGCLLLALALSGCTASTESAPAFDGAWTHHEVASFTETGTPFDLAVGADRIWALAHPERGAGLAEGAPLLLSSTDGITWQVQSTAELGLPDDVAGSPQIVADAERVVVRFTRWDSERSLIAGWLLENRGAGWTVIVDPPESELEALTMIRRGQHPDDAVSNAYLLIPEEDAVIHGVASGPAGLVAVGWEHAEPGAVRTAVAYLAEGERTEPATGWQRVPVPLAAPLARMVPAAGGYLALSDRYEPSLWYSTDGMHWSRLAETAPPGITAVVGMPAGVLVTTPGGVHILGELGFASGAEG